MGSSERGAEIDVDDFASMSFLFMSTVYTQWVVLSCPRPFIKDCSIDPKHSKVLVLGPRVLSLLQPRILCANPTSPWTHDKGYSPPYLRSYSLRVLLFLPGRKLPLHAMSHLLYYNLPCPSFHGPSSTPNILVKTLSNDTIAVS